MTLLTRRSVIVALLITVIFCNFEPAYQSEGDILNGECQPVSQQNVYSIAAVGLLSAVVFALVGILPSVFIRTDADEARFG